MKSIVEVFGNKRNSFLEPFGVVGPTILHARHPMSCDGTEACGRNRCLWTAQQSLGIFEIRKKVLLAGSFRPESSSNRIARVPGMALRILGRLIGSPVCVFPSKRDFGERPWFRCPLPPQKSSPTTNPKHAHGMLQRANSDTDLHLPGSRFPRDGVPKKNDVGSRLGRVKITGHPDARDSWLAVELIDELNWALILRDGESTSFLDFECGFREDDQLLRSLLVEHDHALGDEWSRILNSHGVG